MIMEQSLLSEINFFFMNWLAYILEFILGAVFSAACRFNFLSLSLSLNFCFIFLAARSRANSCVRNRHCTAGSAGSFEKSTTHRNFDLS